MTNSDRFDRREPRASTAHIPAPAFQILNQEQVEALLVYPSATAATQDLDDVVQVILSTGLRAGELRNIRWTDVDLYEHSLVVSVKGIRRAVPLNLTALGILLERREREPEAEFVFSEGQQRCWASHLPGHLATISLRIGAPGLTRQMLRRTFLANLACLDVGAGMSSSTRDRFTKALIRRRANVELQRRRAIAGGTASL